MLSNRSKIIWIHSLVDGGAWQQILDTTAIFGFIKGSLSIFISQVDVCVTLVDKVLAYVEMPFIGCDHQSRPSLTVLKIYLCSSVMQ